MDSEQRASTPGSGILSLGLTVVCWLLCFYEASQSPPREMPLGMLAAFPVAGIMHIVALVAICRGPKLNRWLAAGALILFWGSYGLWCLGGKAGWF